MNAKAFADHHLGTLRGQPPWRDDSRFASGALEKLLDKPGPLDVDKLLERPIFTSRGAVEDLGLDPATMAEWARFLDQVMASSPIEIAVRQQLFQKMKAQNMDPELKKVIFQRAMSLHRNMRKAIYTPAELAGGEPPGRITRVLRPEQLQKAKHRDRIPGGKADKRKRSDFDPEQLRAGTKVEMEHTDDPKLAEEIARDHLAESPDYYRALARMEAKLERKVEKAEPRGGTYYRRVPTAKGDGFTYYYDPEKYGKRKDAHVDGAAMKGVALSGALDRALKAAGDVGCTVDELKALAKKHGGPELAKTLHKRCGKGGDLTYADGRFFAIQRTKGKGKGDE